MKRTAMTVLFLAVLGTMSGVGVIAGAGVGFMAGLPWGLVAGASVAAAVPGLVVVFARYILRIPDRPWLVYLWSLVALAGSLLVLVMNGRLTGAFGGLTYSAVGVVITSVFVIACLAVFSRGRLDTSENR